MKISEVKEPGTKGEWAISKRNVVLQYMLGTNISLRNVAAAVKFLDDVIKQMRSAAGWTDKAGKTHYADDAFKGKIGNWPPNVQPVVSKTGTPDPYAKDTELRASKY